MKKLIILVVVLVVVIAGISIIFGTTSTKSDRTETNKNDANNGKPVDDGIDWIKEGVYLVGTDIPAGEYYVKVTASSGYIEVKSANTDKLSDLITNKSLYSSICVKLKEGEYFDVERCKFVSIDKIPACDLKVGSSAKGGTYKVGRDISVGTYRIVTTNTDTRIEINKSNRNLHDTEGLMRFDNAGAFTYVTLKEGYYLNVDNDFTIEDPTKPANVKVTDGWMQPSVYKVGQDIPAGEYYFKKTGDNIIFDVFLRTNKIHDSINLNPDAFIKVKDGDIIETDSGEFKKASEVPAKTISNNDIRSGMYRVGIDIEAGTYRLKTQEEGTAIKVMYGNNFDINADTTFYEFVQERGAEYDVKMEVGQYLYVGEDVTILSKKA